jgi:DNA-binding transcriptional ArsR family regulator
MSTSSTTAAKILRGVIAHYPEAARIGVICHREHVPAIAGGARTRSILDQATRSRIAVVEHFRGGQARGSNTWTDTCDLLIVLGTPRVRQSVIRTRLIAAGRIETAAREPKWVRDAWSGVDPSGHRHTVRSLAYDDHDWHAAHRSVVAAELLQAVGRGRSICPHGIPVVVVSTEELGHTLAGWELHPVSDAMVEVLTAIRKLSPESPIGNGCHSEGRIIAGKCLNIVKELPAIAPSEGLTAIPTGAIASIVAKSISTVRETLTSVESAGLVSRVGRRGGWKLTSAGLALVTPASERPVTTPHPHDVTGGGGGL